MRSSTSSSSTRHLSLLLLPITLSISVSALQPPSILASFNEPLLSTNTTSSSLSDSPQLEHHPDLLKRDGNCPANYNSCSTFRANAGAACCTAGSTCTTDRGKNIACCPTGAVCTGSLDIAPATTGTGLGGGGGVVFGTGTETVPTTTTNFPGATITPTGTVSYVANAFFPFPYIPTQYPNSLACNSAFQACQTNYAACTAALDGVGSPGSGFGVTIVAPNGGVTASATVQSLGVASATSICSSLSAEGCYNIQSSNCAQFGTGTDGGAGFVAGQTTNWAPRVTAGCVAVGVGMGIGMGILGGI